jgi:hypothetical protein
MRCSSYPNPADAELSIQLDGSDSADWQLSSLEGKIIMHCKLEPGLNSIRLPSSLSKGMYLWQLDGHSSQCGKLVLSR